MLPEPWKDVSSISHPDLKELSDILPSIIANSKRPATIKAYVYAYKRFVRWASTYSELQVLPATERTIALYLVHLQKSGASNGTLTQFTASLAWIHKAARLPCPRHSDLIDLTMSGVRLLAAKPANPKEPLTVDILFKLHAHLIGDNMSTSLVHRRTFTFIILAFTGFLRFDEVSNLKRSDFAIYHEHTDLHIGRSKTDQFRNGQCISIAHTSTPLCPFKNYLAYFQHTNLVHSSNHFIFRSIVKKNEIYKLSEQNKPITYSLAKDCFKLALTAIGVDSNTYGLHSMRSGGCTAAANSGVDPRVFQAHGRWKTTESRNRYILDDLQTKLSVTKGLGI